MNVSREEAAQALDDIGKKPRTRMALARPGRRAFERHVAYLKDLLEGGV